MGKMTMRIHGLAVALAFASTLCLGGCSTSSAVRTPYQMVPGNTFALQLHTPPGASDEGMRLLRENLNTELNARGLAIIDPESDSHVLDVNVTHYRMRPGAARALVGIMAGRDKIESVVTVKNAGDEVLSEYTVTSTNATALGTARGLIEKHAKEIVDTLAQ